ncbi:DNA repair protein RadC [Tyzzerella sp. OttesenSCG-928-J15]|nr:DNA repair protein RadC [Tyzzerella sp. OttesenSCG-928-J15]
MDKNIHKGHRQRMKKRYTDEGSLDSFQDHEVLELLLYYAYAQKDTNGIAHKMINEFGSFVNLVESRPEEIARRCNVSENVAILVSLVPHLSKKHLSGKWGERMEMSNSKLVGEYCVSLYANEHYERFYILCMDTQRRLLRAELIHEGSIDSSAVYPRIIVESALKNKAASVVLSHNHPGGGLLPSKGDIDVTRRVKAALNTVDIEVIDHVIVGGGKYYSFVEKKMPF